MKKLTAILGAVVLTFAGCQQKEATVKKVEPVKPALVKEIEASQKIGIGKSFQRDKWENYSTSSLPYNNIEDVRYDLDKDKNDEIVAFFPVYHTDSGILYSDPRDNAKAIAILNKEEKVIWTYLDYKGEDGILDWEGPPQNK